MDLTYGYVGDVVKHTRDTDGSLIVYGKATGTDLDLDGQRCNGEWLKTAMPAWFRSGGNIREQHDSKRAVGTAVEHEMLANDDHMVRARIVDPVAIAKVEAGVLRGFSIGVKNAGISKTVSAPNGEIDRGAVCELSLVDRPCLPSAVLTMCKAAAPGMDVKAEDFDAEAGIVRVEELTEKTDTADPAEEAAEETDAPADEAPEGDEVEKATDVDDLSAPAPGQTCSQCTEPGHMFCAPVGRSTLSAEDVQVVDSALKAAAGHLEKADSIHAEDSDIEGARAAIAIIGRLIASEAAELAEMPEQSWDIRLLLQAASALHAFISNEHAEAVGEAITTVSLSADPDEAATAVEKAAEGDEEPSADVDKADEPETPETAVLAELEKTLDGLVKTAVDAAIAELTKTLDERVAGLEKSVTADVEKAAGAAPMTSDEIVKALSPALEDEESEIRKQFAAIAEASAGESVEALKALSARVHDVEQMARPGGPALRRTDEERNAARKNDLVSERDRFRSLSTHATDPDLRKGYALRAAELDIELRALPQ